MTLISFNLLKAILFSNILVKVIFNRQYLYNTRMTYTKSAYMLVHNFSSGYDNYSEIYPNNY